MNDRSLLPTRVRRLTAFRVPSSLARTAKRVMLALILALAFLLPPLLVGGAGAARGVIGQRPESPAPLNQAHPDRPAHDPTKHTAVIVAGNAGTESSDLLGPYETLAISGRFNVYVAAPERVLTPLYPGDLSIVPHYSFAEYDAAFGGTVDLLVVPYIPNSETADTAVLDWIREKTDAGTTVLSICAGAVVVADAGVLEGQTTTTHHFSMLAAERTHPEVQWVRGRRYVDSGQFISSAGVTSGIDATLYTLGRMFGREAADRTAQAMGYPHTRFLDDPTWNVRWSDHLSLLASFYRWDQRGIGLVLYDGVRELEVASIIDTYPRSMAAPVRTLAPERSVIRSRHGLDLVPRSDFSTAPALDRLLVPGDGLAPEALAAVQMWAAQQGAGLTVERVHDSGGFPYDATLRDLARRQSNGVANAVATALEYPTQNLQLDGPARQLDLLLRPMALGLLGLGAAVWLRRRAVRTTSVLPSRLRTAALSSGRFTLHFVEMSLAMAAGMVVFHALAGAGGHEPVRDASSLLEQVGMMVAMTVPMVGWMRVRGHGWRHGAEMTVGMLAPVVVVDLLLLAGAATTLPWLQQAAGPGMVLGMLAAMLLRRGHYAGAHASAASSASQRTRTAAGHV